MNENTVFSIGESKSSDNPKSPLFRDESYTDFKFNEVSVKKAREWFSRIDDKQKLDILLEVSYKQWTFPHLLEAAGFSCLEDRFLESPFFGVFVEVINAIRHDVFKKEEKTYKELMARVID